MRVNWSDYEARQERYLDDVRQAEKWHLSRQAKGGRAQSALWQAIKARVLGISQAQLRPARSPWGRGLAYQRK
jgi:SOS response regulatory protein OraA/RecX